MANELEQARNTINDIDAQIAQLFAQRMEAVAQVAAYKAQRGLPITDEAREQALIEAQAAHVGADIRPYYLRFLEQTIDVSKRYQRHLLEGARIAYSGVEGAFAWVAARRAHPHAQVYPYPTFAHAYQAVVEGECDLAVLPLENSNAGEVGQVIDLLFEGPLFINRTVRVPITQNLLGVPGANLDTIQTVISHPQALAQCAHYLEQHGWQTQEAANTAGAAKQVAELGNPQLGAIASAETAQLYGLSLLDHDIHEDANNTTRFGIVSRTASETAQERFMIMFTVANEAGSLAKAINIIGEGGFNMNALHSRPMKSLAWKYFFYIEAEGDINSEAGRTLLEKLTPHCERLKVVGAYAATSELLDTPLD